MPCMYAAAQVLVTGARTATLLQRLPFLPAADAYVCEDGGRIFYPDMTLPTACQIAEDARWRARHTPTGALLALPQCARLVVVHRWMSHSGGQAGPARPRQWVHARVSGAAQRHRCGGGCCKPTCMPWRGGDGQLQREASANVPIRWCAKMASVRVAAVGAPSQEGLPAAERKGVLWDAMRALQKQGWEPDTYSYSTSFRRGCLGACLSCCPGARTGQNFASAGTAATHVVQTD